MGMGRHWDTKLPNGEKKHAMTNLSHMLPGSDTSQVDFVTGPLGLVFHGFSGPGNMTNQHMGGMTIIHMILLFI